MCCLSTLLIPSSRRRAVTNTLKHSAPSSSPSVLPSFNTHQHVSVLAQPFGAAQKPFNAPESIQQSDAEEDTRAAVRPVQPPRPVVVRGVPAKFVPWRAGPTLRNETGLCEILAATVCTVFIFFLSLKPLGKDRGRVGQRDSRGGVPVLLQTQSGGIMAWLPKFMRRIIRAAR